MVRMYRTVVKGTRPAALALVLAATIGTAHGQTAPPAAAKGAINVHGHWKIEVRQTDGTLVSRREFENALTTQGAASVVKVLSRASQPGLWSVVLADDPETPCLGVTTIPWLGGTIGWPLWGCAVVEPGVDGSSYGRSAQTLQANVVAARSEFVLAGTITANRTGHIGVVKTWWLGQLFTSASLSPPIDVAEGQVIEVTVTLTFS